jgi:hypothetical protein
MVVNPGFVMKDLDMSPFEIVMRLLAASSVTLHCHDERSGWRS